MIWIPITVFAALMQAVRTAGQKRLNETMSTMGTTYVRSMAGLPLMIIYLLGVLVVTQDGLPPVTGRYFIHAAAGALSQILATALLIQMLRLRNFAVGTMLTKADIILTALIGTALFSEKLSTGGWLALLLVLAGVIIMLLGKLSGLDTAGEDFAALLRSRASALAPLCALMFALSFLFLREAVLDLGDGNAAWRAAWTVVLATSMQVVCLGIWLWLREAHVFAQIWPNRRIIAFIGLTSALGSIGWYTAFGLQNASYVRAVGQIEAVFTLLLSWAYFKETITRVELTGILITVTGVLMFRLV